MKNHTPSLTLFEILPTLSRLAPNKMKRIIILSLCCYFACDLVKAQDDPQFSQNMYNRLPFNAGYAGSSGATCATLLVRQQWYGFEGAPKTENFAIDGLIPQIHGGLGFSFLHDQIGANRTIGAKVAYAYRMRVFRNGRLALGLDAGLLQKAIDGNSLQVNPNDPSTYDGSIPNGSSIRPDFGFGAYFNTGDFYLGASVAHLFGGKFEIINSNQTTTSSFTLNRHYYLMAGYNYPLNRSLTLKPALFVKSDGAATQFDANITLLVNNLIWGGVSYRLDDAFIVMIGLNITNELKFGYSYDITTSSLKADSYGSHEIMLRYCFRPLKSRPNYMNRTVRYL